LSDTGLYRLQRRLGRYSRFAGLGFVVLSSAFLILSVYNQFIVFELDSIFCFMAAIILLFRDPQARAPVGVLDAVILSSGEAIGDLLAIEGTGFSYVPTGNSIQDVVLMPTEHRTPGLPDGGPDSHSSRALTPPGRALAELYQRQVGMSQVTMEALQASLPDVLRESFAMARSMEMTQQEDRLTVTLHQPSASCTCPNHQEVPDGYIGSPVASFFAVLVAAATKRPVSLQGCSRDPEADTWTLSMVLGPLVEVDA
jgi:hypothetical protein